MPYNICSYVIGRKGQKITYIFHSHIITFCYLLIQFLDICKTGYDPCGTSVGLLTVKHKFGSWLWWWIMSWYHVALRLTSISICGRRFIWAGRRIVRRVVWIFSEIFFTFILFASEKWHFDIQSKCLANKLL